MPTILQTHVTSLSIYINKYVKEALIVCIIMEAIPQAVQAKWMQQDFISSLERLKLAVVEYLDKRPPTVKFISKTVLTKHCVPGSSLNPGL